MPALPPHVTGRPLKPRLSGSSPDTRSDASLPSQQDVVQSLPSQVEHDRFDHSRHGRRQLAGPQVKTGTQQSGDTDTNMGGLEVGVPHPSHYTEQTSHGTAQRALAAMLRDADLHEANEKANEYQRQHERRDSGFMEFAAIEKPVAPNKKKRDAAPCDAKQPLQSLAATHPSLYYQLLTKPIPKISARVRPNNDPEVVRAEPPPEQPQPLVKPWQTGSDLKDLRRPSPTHDDARIMRREEDIDPQRPNIISPVRMTGLPFGTRIEVACDYEEEIDDDVYTAQ